MLTVSQIDAYDELTKNTDAPISLSYDGTTKASVHLRGLAANVRTGDNNNKTMMLSMRGTPDGTAESGMQAITDTFQDLNRVGRFALADRQPLTFARIGGTLSDHNTTEKKISRLVQRERVKEGEVNELTRFGCWNHKYYVSSHMQSYCVLMWYVLYVNVQIGVTGRSIEGIYEDYT
jgi:hypothetical protein